MRVFLIDDEKLYFKILNPVLKKHGHQLGYSSSGEDGLRKIAAFDPDVIILDVRLPDMTGFDILALLKDDNHFKHVPVIFVTSLDELESKLKAFNLGAEDYLTKPFKPEELLARLEVLARRREYLKDVESYTQVKTELASIVTVHSLRGGVGCTSLAVNLGLAYYRLWLRPTILVDGILTSGQVALFLNASPKSTWKDLATQTFDDVDVSMIKSLVNMQKNGISFVASPNLPTPFEDMNLIFPKALEEFRTQNDFIVLDIPHDFSDISVMALDAADHIVLLLAPEMASLRAAICALRTYERLEYPMSKVRVVINNTSQSGGLKMNQIEKALGREVDLEIPFSQVVNHAINTGEPFVISEPSQPISLRVQEFAFKISRDVLKKVPPAAPTATWKAVAKSLKTGR